MPRRTSLTRRGFIRRAGALAGGLGLWGGLPFPSRSGPLGANARLDLGVIGTANRAAANIAGLGTENLVALCDVDENFLGALGEKLPGAKRYTDFRKLIEKEHLDGVIVSTADHTHAPATLAALDAGLHVYCEKPLAHTVEEARLVAEAAAKKKVVTQLGTQIHSHDNYRRVVELIQSGAIGSVTEAHAWVGKAWGGRTELEDGGPTPTHFHHDLWLGPAPERPYHDFYHPAQWRRFWDFGGGTLGDMGCHLLDLPFWALELRHPVKVSAQGPPPDPETAPVKMRASWDFPSRMSRIGGKLPEVTLHWHDGGLRPPQLDGDLGLPAKDPPIQFGSGVLFVGTKGMLICDYGRRFLLPDEKFKDFSPPPPSLKSSSGHYREWVDAIRGKGAALCDFQYSGALTETVLLGNVAYRAEEPFGWEAKKLRASSLRAQAFITKENRPGWF